MIWFTSDQHYKHINILRYCLNRTYKNIKEMDASLIELHNSKIAPTDKVFYLGDFCLDTNPEVIQSYLSRLNGNKHLILGNHDKLKPFQYVECGFTSVHTSLKVEDFYLAHDPSMAVALPYGAKLLHGHVHGLFKTLNSSTGVTMINVGVDVWNMAPVSMDEINAIL